MGKRCHRELAKLYHDLLQEEGLLVRLEPARQTTERGETQAVRKQHPLRLLRRTVDRRSVAKAFSNKRFGLSRLGLVGLGVAQFAFLRGADAFDTPRLPGPEETEGGGIAVQEG